jgi:hypothetical protein
VLAQPIAGTGLIGHRRGTGIPTRGHRAWGARGGTAASELGVALAVTRAPPWKCTLTGQVYGGGGSLERGGGDKAMGAHRW